jgi:hypothetical protein
MEQIHFLAPEIGPRFILAGVFESPSIVSTSYNRIGIDQNSKQSPAKLAEKTISAA